MSKSSKPRSERKTSVPSIRDRIKDFRRVKASELLRNPKNWRTHPQEQQAALRGILAEVGIVDALIARELENGDLELIDGHLRSDAEPDTEWPVLVLDVTEEESLKVLATLDPLSAMAGVDVAKLGKLLGEVETGSEALSEMLSAIAEQNGIHTESGTSELKTLDIKPPPAMTWVLIGIPTVQFGQIAETVESIATIEQAIVETTSNDG